MIFNKIPPTNVDFITYNRLLPATSAPISRPQNPEICSASPLNSESVNEKNLKKTNAFIFTLEKKEILHGILLGDANLATENKGQTFRLRLVQSESHKEYLDHLVTHFEELGRTPVKQNPANNTYYWNSLQSASLRYYGHQFYREINGKWVKKVPENVKKWLTPRAVTYWILDDGSAKDKKTTTALRLCTDSFSYLDVKKLSEALEENFNIETSIYENRPNQYRIYCKAPSVNSLWVQITPILQNEIAPTSPQILQKLPNKIYAQLKLD